MRSFWNSSPVWQVDRENDHSTAATKNKMYNFTQLFSFCAAVKYSTFNFILDVWNYCQMMLHASKLNARNLVDNIIYRLYAQTNTKTHDNWKIKMHLPNMHNKCTQITICNNHNVNTITVWIESQKPFQDWTAIPSYVHASGHNWGTNKLPHKWLSETVSILVLSTKDVLSVLLFAELLISSEFVRI